MTKSLVRLENIITGMVRVPAIVASGILFLLMFLTVGGVVMRRVLGSPITGMQEYSEVCQLVVIFLFLAYSGWTGGQIAVELIGSVLKGLTYRIVCSITSIASAGLMATISWQTFRQGTEVGKLGVTFNMSQIPHEPLYYFAAAGCALYAFVLIITASRLVLGLPEFPKQ